MAVLRDDIAAAKKQLLYTLGSNREIRLLESYLNGQERVEAMCAGIYSGGRGIIVLTDQRVFFLKDGWFKKTTQDFPFYSISSVEWDSRLFTGDMILFSDGSQAEIKKVTSKTGKRLVGLIRERAGRRGMQQPQQGYLSTGSFPQQPQDSVVGFGGRFPMQQPPAPPVPPAAPVRPVSGGVTDEPSANDLMLDRLERLKRLHDGGMVSDEQFEAAKRNIMGG